MGVPVSGTPDLAFKVLSGTISTTGLTVVGGAGNGVYMPPAFNAVLIGAFNGTINLVRSFDGGTTWTPAVGLDGRTALTFSAPGGATPGELETGVIYGWNCTALSSGTPAWRVSW